MIALRGPGLTKTCTPPLLRSRTVRLLSTNDARWHALFEEADVMSEGAPRGEDPQRTYYGSTDILLAVAPERPGDTNERYAALAALDPHLRLRAMRLAHREAAQRASGPLARLSTEITVRSHDVGINVHVEVEARVLPDRRQQARAPESSSPPT